MCFLGGVLFLSSIGELLYVPGGYLAFAALIFGIFVIIGAFIRLKYQAGSLFCLFWVIVSPLTYARIISLIYLFGTIFTLIGSIVGIIGGILNNKWAYKL
jgi:hypothetical protein